MKNETKAQGQEIVAGLDIITKTVLEKAETEKAEILKKAEAEAEEICQSYENRAQSILDAAKEKAEKESAISRERATSAALNHKRNLLLFKKGELVSAAFDKAEEALLSLDGERYFLLLLSFLNRTLDEYLESEKLGVEYEGDSYEKTAALSLAMAERDLALGEKLILAVAPRLSECGKTLTLDQCDKTITAGFVLIAGNIRMDASISKLIDSQKASLEADVYRILFA